MITLIAKAVLYYSQHDEDAFFSWIGNIPAIASVRGKGDSLFIEVNYDAISENDVRDIIALFYRYNVDMTQLRKLVNTENAAWLTDVKMYWHSRVFGGDNAAAV